VILFKLLPTVGEMVNRTDGGLSPELAVSNDPNVSSVL